MVLGIFDDPTRAVLASTMDACAERNRTIANNVANADTPGFRRSVVNFEDTLKDMLRDGTVNDVEQARRLKASVETDDTPSTRMDGNNVNIDREMADLARNSIEYNALVEFTRLKSGMLTTVISGGTR